MYKIMNSYQEYIKVLKEEKEKSKIRRRIKKKQKYFKEHQNARKVDYKKYLKSKHWIMVRNKCLKEQKVCNICDNKKGLQAHHRKYTHNGKSVLYNEDKIDGLIIILCSECHNLWHEHFKLKVLSLKHITELKNYLNIYNDKKTAFQQLKEILKNYLKGQDYQKGRKSIYKDKSSDWRHIGVKEQLDETEYNRRKLLRIQDK